MFHRTYSTYHGPLIKYVKLWVVHAPGMPGTFRRHRFRRKPLVSDPGMLHGTWVTDVPWCMWASLTGGGGENVPGIPGACPAHNFTYLVRCPCRRTKLVINYILKKIECESNMLDTWFPIHCICPCRYITLFSLPLCYPVPKHYSTNTVCYTMETTLLWL